MKYKIKSISPKDAYYPNRKEIVGALVEIEEDKRITDGGWTGGVITYIGKDPLVWEYPDGVEVIMEKGDTFYFHKVRLEPV